MNAMQTSLRIVGMCAVSTPEQADDEKTSLEEQERLIRQWCDEHGHTLVDLLIVPGFSRRYYNLPELIEASLKQKPPVDAPARLLAHTRSRDFDVFACRYGSRFAREQSIFAEIVSRVIDAGAVMFTFQDGWINRSNYRMYIAMGGYAASTEVDRLVSALNEAQNKLVANGLPPAGRVRMSHRVARDRLGKVVAVEVDPTKRRLLDDIAYLLVDENVPWLRMSQLLYERYGHTTAKGRPIEVRTLWRLLYSPTFWGHTARFFEKLGAFGVWAFDESEPVPDGVVVYRNQFEPAYTGEQAERVKAELRRRADIIKGRARPGGAYMFTGLLMCDDCGFRMVRRVGGTRHDYIIYRCDSTTPRYRHDARYQCAANPRAVTQDAAKAWFDVQLRQMLAQHNPLHFRVSASVDVAARITSLQAEIAEAERRIAGLLLQRADTPLASQNILVQLIQDADTRLQALRAQLADALRQQASDNTAGAEAAYHELEQLGVDALWMLPENTINRILAALLGRYRILVADANFVGPSPARKR
jgi:hypothetical protein